VFGSVPPGFTCGIATTGLKRLTHREETRHAAAATLRRRARPGHRRRRARPGRRAGPGRRRPPRVGGAPGPGGLRRRHLAVVRAAGRPRHRAAVRQRRRRRHPQPLHLAHQRRHLPVEHPGRPRPRHHPGVRGPRPHLQDARRARRAGAPRAKRHVLQLVRPGDRRQAHHLAGGRQPRVPVPVHRRQRLARRRAGDGPQRRAAARRAGGRAAGPDGLRRLLRPGRRAAAGRLLGRPAGHHLHLPGPWRPLHLPPLRRPQHRAADRQLPRDRLRAGAGHPLLQDVADLPRHLRLGLAGAAAGGCNPHLPRRGGVRGQLRVPWHAPGAELGRQHVRGADGAAAGAGGALGAA